MQQCCDLGKKSWLAGVLFVHLLWRLAVVKREGEILCGNPTPTGVSLTIPHLGFSSGLQGCETFGEGASLPVPWESTWAPVGSVPALCSSTNPLFPGRLAFSESQG